MARKRLLDAALLPDARAVAARLRAVGGSWKLVPNAAGEFTRARLLPPDIYHAMPTADKDFIRRHKPEFIAALMEVSAIPTDGDVPLPPAPAPPTTPPATSPPPALPPVGPDGMRGYTPEQYGEVLAWRDRERERRRNEAPAPEPTVAVKFRDRMDGPIEFIPTRLFNPETHVEWDFSTRTPR